MNRPGLGLPAAGDPQRAGARVRWSHESRCCYKPRDSHGHLEWVVAGAFVI
jgi:hypothetical protein